MLFLLTATPFNRTNYQYSGEEIFIIFVVLCAWIFAVVIFIHQWQKIRVLQPSEPRYKHNPKNLEMIKVVKKPKDSVICRTLPRSLSRTMQARQRKQFERMHTMPNISLQLEGGEKEAKKFERMKTAPVLPIKGALTTLVELSIHSDHPEKTIGEGKRKKRRSKRSTSSSRSSVHFEDESTHKTTSFSSCPNLRKSNSVCNSLSEASDIFMELIRIDSDNEAGEAV